MHIASVGSVPMPTPAVKTPETVEGPGPDRDGDADNQGAAAVQAAPAPGVGQLINTSA